MSCLFSTQPSLSASVNPHKGSAWDETRESAVEYVDTSMPKHPPQNYNVFLGKPKESAKKIKEIISLRLQESSESIKSDF